MTDQVRLVLRPHTDSRETRHILKPPSGWTWWGRDTSIPQTDQKAPLVQKNNEHWSFNPNLHMYVLRTWIQSHVSICSSDDVNLTVQDRGWCSCPVPQHWSQLRPGVLQRVIPITQSVCLKKIFISSELCFSVMYMCGCVCRPLYCVNAGHSIETPECNEASVHLYNTHPWPWRGEGGHVQTPGVTLWIIPNT